MTTDSAWMVKILAWIHLVLAGTTMTGYGSMAITFFRHCANSGEDDDPPPCPPVIWWNATGFVFMAFILLDTVIPLVLIFVVSKRSVCGLKFCWFFLILDTICTILLTILSIQGGLDLNFSPVVMTNTMIICAVSLPIKMALLALSPIHRDHLLRQNEAIKVDYSMVDDGATMGSIMKGPQAVFESPKTGAGRPFLNV